MKCVSRHRDSIKPNVMSRDARSSNFFRRVLCFTGRHKFPHFTVFSTSPSCLITSGLSSYRWLFIPCARDVYYSRRPVTYMHPPLPRVQKLNDVLWSAKRLSMIYMSIPDSVRSKKPAQEKSRCIFIRSRSRMFRVFNCHKKGQDLFQTLVVRKTFLLQRHNRCDIIKLCIFI